MRVNTYAGNLTYHRQDFYIPGRGLDTEMTFYYNSSQKKDWGYGTGWSHNYNIVLEIRTGNKYAVIWGNGSEDEFTKSGSTFTPPVGVYHTLTEYEPQKYLLRTKHGMKYYFEDAKRRITKIEDRNGNTMTFTYNFIGLNNITDPSGRVVQFVWEFGRMTKMVEAFDSPSRTWDYTYNDKNNLETVTNPMGYEVSYYYSLKNPHQLVLMVDENMSETFVNFRTDGYVGTVTTCLTKHEFSYSRTDSAGHAYVKELVEGESLLTTFAYDTLGRNTTRSGNCCGNENTFLWDSNNNIIQNIDADGNLHTYEYDAANNISKLIDPLGCMVEITYEPNYSQMTSYKDKNGNFTILEHNTNGNLIKITRPLGNVEIYTYNSSGLAIEYTDGNGNLKTFEYNSNGDLFRINHPLGFTSEYSYDNRGNRVSRIDANGHSTYYEYDLLNRLTKITDAIGGITTFIYDPKDKIKQMTNAKGQTTIFIYDAMDRLIQLNAPGNLVYQYSYDGLSNLIQVKNPRGGIISYGYNQQNLLETITDQMGFITTFSYDAAGNQISTTDPNGNTTSFAYNPLNHVETITTPLGHQTHFSYDCNQNLSSITDANNNTISVAYDALNRATSMTDALGATSQFDYDANNNLIKITDAKDNETNYSYDGLNRNTLITFADNTIRTYTHDSLGNVISSADNNGNTIQYIYDALNRLTLRDYPDTNDDQFQYDAIGNIILSENENATITFTYDEANRLTSETLNGKSTQYVYNILIGKITLIYPSGKVIEEHYDERAKLTYIKENGNFLAGFQYDNAGRLVSRNYSNGTSSHYTYNANNRLTSITYNPNAFIELLYNYDNTGNMLIQEYAHKPDHSETYTYDANYRLVNYRKGLLNNNVISFPTNEITYNYDELGNRTFVVEDSVTTVYITNEMNEYTSIVENQNMNFTYDENGNLISHDSTSYVYDFENRLLELHKNNINIHFTYDAFGRRIEKYTSEDSLLYFYDSQREIQVTNQFTNENEYRVFSSHIDDVLKLEKNDSSYFLGKNHINSTVVSTDNFGDIKEFYEYSPFGEASYFDDEYFYLPISEVTVSLFTGRDLILGNSIFNYRARTYSSEFGRFIQRDPLDFLDGLNLYTYVQNAPTIFVDPFGTQSEICIPWEWPEDLQEKMREKLKDDFGDDIPECSKDLGNPQTQDETPPADNRENNRRDYETCIAACNIGSATDEKAKRYPIFDEKPKGKGECLKHCNEAFDATPRPPIGLSRPTLIYPLLYFLKQCYNKF